MGFRFRRSIKIAKGVRVNFGKKGASVSVGTRGFRKTFHTSGRKTTSVGIPGTGLSYVSSKKKGKKNVTSQSHAAAKSRTIENKLNENKKIVDQYNQYIHEITSLHQELPEPMNWDDIVNIPEPFSKGDIGPLQHDARRRYHEYSPNLMERIFTSLRTKKERKLQEEIQLAAKQDQANYQEWLELNNLARLVIAGDSTAYRKVIEESSDFENLKKLGFKYKIHDAQTVEMELQVNGEKVVPRETVTLTKAGNVSKKEIGKKNYHEIKKDFVCSHAIWAARHLFAYLPIQTCVIHVTESALNTATGHVENQVILSVLCDRATLDTLNFERLDPSDAMENFKHHIDHLVTKGFRSVERITEW